MAGRVFDENVQKIQSSRNQWSYKTENLIS